MTMLDESTSEASSVTSSAWVPPSNKPMWRETKQEVWSKAAEDRAEQVAARAAVEAAAERRAVGLPPEATEEQLKFARRIAAAEALEAAAAMPAGVLLDERC